MRIYGNLRQKNQQRSAFSVIEYTFLIAIIAAVLIGMSIYLKHALCGKWRAVGDTFGYGRQYEVNKTTIK
ncbi:MAG: hypothetical protein QME65_02805 [Candidatus Omnitrophota bacterium]|nr:hypothetical protein [Candidatus Omnitrophota bacterium]